MAGRPRLVEGEFSGIPVCAKVPPSVFDQLAKVVHDDPDAYPTLSALIRSIVGEWLYQRSIDHPVNTECNCERCVSRVDRVNMTGYLISRISK